MSLYVYTAAKSQSAAPFRNKRPPGQLPRPRPHCGSGKTQFFAGDPAKFLPPCSPELKGELPHLEDQ